MTSLGLDVWWDEPEYKPCNTLRLRGLFILRKLSEQDAAKFQDVMTDLYRDDQPEPEDIGGVAPVSWTGHGFRPTRRLGGVVHS